MTVRPAIELTPAGVVHAQLLAGMHHICFAEPWSADAMAGTLAMPGTFGLVAVDGGSLAPSLAPPGPAGLVLWRVVLDEAEILTIAVLPPWRRHGVGGVLLSAALAQSAECGASSMFLEAAANNHPALSLYEKSGFCRVGLRKAYYGHTDAVLMRKELLPTPSCG